MNLPIAKSPMLPVLSLGDHVTIRIHIVEWSPPCNNNNIMMMMIMLMLNVKMIEFNNNSNEVLMQESTEYIEDSYY